jgi:hypothetical protein
MIDTPPSTSIALPVTNEDASEARNSTARAISSGSAIRFNRERHELANRGGVVEGDIEAAEPIDRARDECSRERLVTNITVDRDGLPAEGGDLGDHGVELGPSSCRHDDARSLASKQQCRRAPDSRARASDDRDLA